MKHFFSFSLFCFSLAFVVSCSSRKPPEPVKIETTRTITQVVKDTLFKVDADSTFYQAWIDCQNGKPVIIRTVQEAEDFNRKNPGAGAEPAKSQPGKHTKVNATLKNGKLNVDCHQEALNIFKSWKEKYISENQKTTVPVYVEKPYPWYVVTLNILGASMLIMLIIMIALKFIKPS